MIGFIIGVVIGGALGVTLMCCLFMARDREEQTEKEPTALLTVGALVNWNGDVYEIERFEADNDGQTMAYITDARLRLIVPVEELEGVRE